MFSKVDTLEVFMAWFLPAPLEVPEDDEDDGAWKRDFVSEGSGNLRRSRHREQGTNGMLQRSCPLGAVDIVRGRQAKSPREEHLAECADVTL